VKLKESKKPQKLPWLSIRPDIRTLFVSNKKFSSIHVEVAGDDDWPDKVLFLHGNPSTSEEWHHAFPAMIYAKF